MTKKPRPGPSTKSLTRVGCRSLAELVERYDLRNAHEPDRPYPVEGNYELPKGWIPLVERLIRRLIRLGWDRRLAQAKEKFGGLRFYVDKQTGLVTEDLLQAIERARDKADVTCSVCGCSGKARECGPLDPRCEEHAAKG